jgi:hypothetical protein
MHAAHCSHPPMLRGHRTLFLAALLFCPALSAGGRQPGAAPQALPTLTTAESAHDLPAEQASRGYPEHLRLVVTYYDPDTDPKVGAFFACDPTGCIVALVPPRPVLPIKLGTVVEVTGRSDPGNYAPIMIASRVRAVGEAPVPFGPARRSLAELMTGADDSHWVEVEAVVHSAQQSSHTVILTLALEDGTIRGVAPLEEGADYERLVDSKVLVRGNGAPVWTKNRQMVGARLLFPSLATVTIEEPAPADPFSLPVRPINSLMRFTPGARFAHRVRVSGQVTLQWPGRWLYIQDGSQGLFIPTVQTTPLKLGDVVDAVGFPAMGESSAMLEDAIFKLQGSAQSTIPTPSITAQDAMTGDYDAKLVQIQGHLVNQDLSSENPTLVMSSGGMLFFAVLPKRNQSRGDTGVLAGQAASWNSPESARWKWISICPRSGRAPRIADVVSRAAALVAGCAWSGKSHRGGRRAESLPCWRSSRTDRFSFGTLWVAASEAAGAGAHGNHPRHAGVHRGRNSGGGLGGRSRRA